MKITVPLLGKGLVSWSHIEKTCALDTTLALTGLRFQTYIDYKWFTVFSFTDISDYQDKLGKYTGIQKNTSVLDLLPRFELTRPE